MKVCDYIEEGMRQLMYTNTYKPLETDPTEDLNKEIKNMVAEYSSLNLIDETTAEILVHPKPRPGRFYMLRKIHKMNNPGRPIISGNDTATERLSLFVNLHLHPIVQELPSFVKDTSHFLQIIEKLNQTNTFDDDTLLATFDVTSLYTNIPHDDGLMALSEALNKRTVKKPSTNVLTTLQELSLNPTISPSMENTIYRYKGHPWALGWLLPMQIPSWANWSTTYLRVLTTNHWYGYDTLMTYL
ncbi:hypothetical protein NDU88_000736 [Pleurodeles waltl]|uniref:Reverse transcriptase domain-containing protein n=1 Tax=Pleurodeles waltl TaxID=8319 RepID=A0AAV7UQU2_PLEWA|nr:hypothetical protein NDU88_000736 [Pleurodeles waltl]